MAYIEPCCCDRQLSALIREHQFCFFQTGGDVTLEKLLDAVASTAGDGHTLILAVPEADLQLMRTLANYFRRRWTNGLLLITQANQSELVSAELKDHLPCVHYAFDPMILDGLCAIVGLRQAVIIQGAILSQPDFSLCQYAAWRGNNADLLSQAVDPLIAKFRTKPVLRAADNCQAVDRILKRQFFDA